MEHERRSRDRCTVCQGPTRVDAEGKVRCRNSMCAFNHQSEICPRCKHQGPEVLRYEQSTFQYQCGECMNRWSRAG